MVSGFLNAEYMSKIIFFFAGSKRKTKKGRPNRVPLKDYTASLFSQTDVDEKPGSLLFHALIDR